MLRVGLVFAELVHQAFGIVMFVAQDAAAYGQGLLETDAGLGELLRPLVTQPAQNAAQAVCR